MVTVSVPYFFEQLERGQVDARRPCRIAVGLARLDVSPAVGLLATSGRPTRPPRRDRPCRRGPSARRSRRSVPWRRGNPAPGPALPRPTIRNRDSRNRLTHSPMSVSGTGSSAHFISPAAGNVFAIDLLALPGERGGRGAGLADVGELPGHRHQVVQPRGADTAAAGMLATAEFAVAGQEHAASRPGTRRPRASACPAGRSGRSAAAGSSRASSRRPGSRRPRPSGRPPSARRPGSRRSPARTRSPGSPRRSRARISCCRPSVSKPG